MMRIPPVRPALIIAAAAWVGVLAWLVPSRVVVLGDDFGYVDAVVGTVRAHRWVAGEWLGPLNLPLTLASAGVFVATDNFYVSTLGLNLFLALVNLLLLSVCLKPVLPSEAARWPVVFAVSLCPVWLHKTIEFTGLPLGIACLLIAWLSWQRGWRWIFFASVITATRNRESALCLLAWPLVALWRQWRSRATVGHGLLLGCAVTVGVTLVAGLAAPLSWTRKVVLANLSNHFSPVQIGSNLVLAFVVLTGLRAALNVLRGEALAATWRANLARPLRPMLFMLAGAVIVLCGGTDILWETPGLERFSPVVVLVATLTGAWFHRWDDPPSLEVAVYLSGYVLLVSWRGLWWDYYLIEPMLILLLASGGTQMTPSPARTRLLAWTVVALWLVWIPGFKLRLSEGEARIVAYEKALRAGQVSVVELSDAPFGFLAWKLFPVACAHPGAKELIDFLRFVEGARAHYSNGVITVNRDGGRKSIHPSRESWTLPQGFSPRLLPLDNAEWRTYIRAVPNR